MMLISIRALFVRIIKENPFRQAADICDGSLMPQGLSFLLHVSFCVEKKDGAASFFMYHAQTS